MNKMIFFVLVMSSLLFLWSCEEKAPLETEKTTEKIANQVAATPERNAVQVAVQPNPAVQLANTVPTGLVRPIGQGRVARNNQDLVRLGLTQQDYLDALNGFGGPATTILRSILTQNFPCGIRSGIEMTDAELSALIRQEDAGYEALETKIGFLLFRSQNQRIQNTRTMPLVLADRKMRAFFRPANPVQQIEVFFNADPGIITIDRAINANACQVHLEASLNILTSVFLRFGLIPTNPRGGAANMGLFPL